MALLMLERSRQPPDKQCGMPAAHSIRVGGNAVVLNQLREFAGHEPVVVIGVEDSRRTMAADRLEAITRRYHGQELPQRRSAAASIHYIEQASCLTCDDL